MNEGENVDVPPNADNGNVPLETSNPVPTPAAAAEPAEELLADQSTENTWLGESEEQANES